MLIGDIFRNIVYISDTKILAVHLREYYLNMLHIPLEINVKN